jgi:Putative lumazine-binding
MNRHVPSAAALLLCLPLLALGQESKSAAEVAIRQVVQLYIDGVKNNDTGSLSKSLHPRGKWFSHHTPKT